jgi:hypothetical protein
MRRIEKCYYLELGDQEIEFTLVSEVWFGDKGSSPFCSIEKAYPPTPDEVDHIHVRGGDVLLTTDEFLKLAEQFNEHLTIGDLDEAAFIAAADAAADEYADKVDQAYDAWRDRQMDRQLDDLD